MAACKAAFFIKQLFCLQKMLKAALFAAAVFSYSLHLTKNISSKALPLFLMHKCVLLHQLSVADKKDAFKMVFIILKTSAVCMLEACA